MRIGFRHCLLSSCLFRCSAGCLRRDGKAVVSAGPLPGWQTWLPLQWEEPLLQRQPHSRFLHNLPSHVSPALPSLCPLPWAPVRPCTDNSSPAAALGLGTMLADGELCCGLPRRAPSLSALAPLASSASQFVEVEDLLLEKHKPARSSKHCLVREQFPTDYQDLFLCFPELGKIPD